MFLYIFIDEWMYEKYSNKSELYVRQGNKAISSIKIQHSELTNGHGSTKFKNKPNVQHSQFSHPNPCF